MSAQAAAAVLSAAGGLQPKTSSSARSDGTQVTYDYGGPVVVAPSINIGSILEPLTGDPSNGGQGSIISRFLSGTPSPGAGGGGALTVSAGASLPSWVWIIAAGAGAYIVYKMVKK